MPGVLHLVSAVVVVGVVAILKGKRRRPGRVFATKLHAEVVLEQRPFHRHDRAESANANEGDETANRAEKRRPPGPHPHHHDTQPDDGDQLSSPRGDAGVGRS